MSRGRFVGFLAALAVALLSGCFSPPPPPPQGPDQFMGGTGRFQVGELVRIDFSGLATPPLPHEEHVKEDGTITLPLIGSVRAAGRTPGELQREIHESYVPRYYRNLNVTVRGADLYYFVGGEVKAPGRQQYLGPITVTGAIKSAGDFTDFANRRRVQLKRADGSVYTIDADEAERNTNLDVRVYPGDSITVKRRIL